MRLNPTSIFFSGKIKDAALREAAKKTQNKDFSPIERRKKRRTHLVEEKEKLPKPQTVKNEIGYIWWIAMPQQNAQILFMEMD